MCQSGEIVNKSEEPELEYDELALKGVCDVCQAPATQFARDVIDTTEPTDRISTYDVSPILKRGCDKHPVESKEVPRFAQRKGVVIS